MSPRLLSLLCLLALLSVASTGQEAQHGTERRGLGFEGPVRSVLTTIARPNPDPRVEGQRKLFTQATPDWAVFDTQGRRIESGSASSSDRIEAISKCTFMSDGTRVCADSTGQHSEARRQDTTLADGDRQVAYFRGSKMESREVTRFDEKGRAVASRNYDGNGRLTSEDSTQLSDDGETTTWKIYGESGHVALNVRTRVSDDNTRVDRWSYDSEGRLVWHLALNNDGEVLSSWYEVGYKPELSSSDSLGICRSRLCVSYKFDEQGSGRMEKTVRHTPGEGYLEPDSEEHYNLNSVLDEKAEIKYARDDRGNWTSRSVFVWDASSNQMIEVERDTRTIEYY